MRFISVIYVLLLAYIIAAIAFWGHTLDQQSEKLYQNEIRTLQEHVDSIGQYERYRYQKKQIDQRLNARKRQYTGEGITFLLVMLIGAGIVYSTIRSRNRLAQQQTNFILSITHELKSPIAAVKLNLQTLSRRQLDEDTQKTLIDRSVTEANRLDDLCNNLLLASQMEDRHFEPGSERINFSTLVKESVAIMQGRTKEPIVTELSEDCFTYGDALLWKLVVSNLLENAVKYGQSDKAIKVILSPLDDQLSLKIIDEGMGIPDEEKTKIFKKFYRVGNENARKTKGTGLGLYLTARIISQFNGTISVSDNEPKGSIFEVNLPAG